MKKKILIGAGIALIGLNIYWIWSIVQMGWQGWPALLVGFEIVITALIVLMIAAQWELTGWIAMSVLFGIAWYLEKKPLTEDPLINFLIPLMFFLCGIITLFYSALLAGERERNADWKLPIT